MINVKKIDNYLLLLFLVFSLIYFLLFDRNIRIGISECFWNELLAISFFVNFVQFMLIAIFSNKVSEDFKRSAINCRLIFAFIIVYALGVVAFVVLVSNLGEWCDEKIYFVEVVFRSIVFYGMTWGVLYPIKLIRIFI